MDEFQNKAAADLFSEFANSPSGKILFESNGNGDEISAQMITQKLKKDDYASVFDFVIDVREIFLVLEKKYENNIPYLIATEELSSRFEKKICKLPRSKDEKLHYALLKCSKKLSRVRIAMSMSSFNPDAKAGPAKAAQPKPSRRASVSVVQELQKAIDSISSIGTLAEISRILKKYIPNFELKETATIELSSLSPQCIEDLRRLLEKPEDREEPPQ